MVKTKDKLLDIWSFDKSTIVGMKKLIKETKSDGSERAALLCSDIDNRLKLQAKCVGDSCSIEKYKGGCKEKTLRTGTFHTHPKGNNLNIHDIQKAREREETLQCIGKATNGKIECFIDKENSFNFYENLRNEKPILDAMVKRGHEVQDCIRHVKNNMPIIEAYTNDYITRNLKKFNPMNYTI